MTTTTTTTKPSDEKKNGDITGRIGESVTQNDTNNNNNGNGGDSGGGGKKASQSSSTTTRSYEDLGSHHLTVSQDMDKRQPHKEERELRFSRRENTEFKWRHEPTVIGALECRSEPTLDIHAKMKKHDIPSCEDDFHECLKIWNQTNVKQSFINAYESITPATKCCGLVNDIDQTIKDNVPIMNKKWCKAINDKPEWKDKGYYLDLFVWRWSNPTGKAETVILMVRFHKKIEK